MALCGLPYADKLIGQKWKKHPEPIEKVKFRLIEQVRKKVWLKR
ncbi:hypothetical protein BLGI_5001 [Brevibacillus laterosporus GI-9]|nr:hypothetical protein BLGI_5001 [Brevibacillus laterosporus GI-9]